ncbi:MAG: DNA-3-methyladenine glycosylase 2 family protein [Pseudomonadota bacterium]
MSTPTLLSSDADVRAGIAWLSAADPGLARAADVTGPVARRHRGAGFRALFHAILSQQVSVASAAAIWARVEAAGLVTPEVVVAGGEAPLKACGLSRQKVRYVLALAGAGIDFDRLETLPDKAVIETLVAVPGIGLWTAEIYAMFSLCRRDVFAAGDLALQEAVRHLYDLPERPKERALRARAEAWSPWRTVAATLLFQYYGAVKGREGVG